MPPCTTLRDSADVALEKSFRSTNATESPRWAASQAAAAPQMPPPTTRRSNSPVDRADRSLRISVHDPGSRAKILFDRAYSIEQTVPPSIRGAQGRALGQE